MVASGDNIQSQNMKKKLTGWNFFYGLIWKLSFQIFPVVVGQL